MLWYVKLSFPFIELGGEEWQWTSFYMEIHFQNVSEHKRQILCSVDSRFFDRFLSANFNSYCVTKGVTFRQKMSLRRKVHFRMNFSSIELSMLRRVFFVHCHSIPPNSMGLHTFKIKKLSFDSTRSSRSIFSTVK